MEGGKVMPNLRVRPSGDHGRVISITPDSAGWTYVGFDVVRLRPGETSFADTEDREACLVLIEGRAVVTAGTEDFGLIGERMTPFSGKPHAVYVPAGASWSVKAATDVTLGVCSAPGKRGARPARHIDPADLVQETRGKGRNTRLVTGILPEGEPADSLIVVEVITPAGNTSSYPPHKHDVDDLPTESCLEETYYHRVNPAQGWVFQRVYTDDRSLDEAMALEDGDVAMVPRGYHPVATLHGYDSYYLNVMAGPTRTWKFHNAPEHEWLFRL
jgi:5-deoxy-glucuronate isomerase